MTTIKNLKFKDGSFIELIAKKYLEENKTINEIFEELKETHNLKTNKKVLDYVWLINKRLSKLGVNNTLENSSIIQEVQENPLHIHCKQKGNNLVLFIKTNKKFEDWMIKKKVLQTINNLWDERRTTEAYHGAMISRSDFDDLNKPVILQNSLNYAILRLKGISEGIEIPINKNLVTKERLIELLIDFSRKFDNFYSEKIIKNKIDIELNIEEKQND